MENALIQVTQEKLWNNWVLYLDMPAPSVLRGLMRSNALAADG